MTRHVPGGMTHRPLIWFLLSATMAAVGWAQLPEGYSLEPVREVDFRIYALDWDPDGRVFMSDFFGNVKLAEADWTVQEETVISFDVSIAQQEEGMQGIAVDPDFALNRHVYVYTVDPSRERNHIHRFTEVEGRGTDVVEVIDLEDPVPADGIHNAGTMQFGPDGQLYVAVGDGGFISEAAQRDDSLFGKIIRLPVEGPLPLPSSPEDRPQYFVCRGLRNPYGFDFNPVNGLIYATENGEQENDELNRIVPGGNYGWPTVSGFSPSPEFVDPLITWTPPIAPAGMAFLESPPYPAGNHGDILFASFNQICIHHVTLGGPTLGEVVTDEIWLTVADFTSGERIYFPTNLFTGPQGRIHITSNTFGDPESDSGIIWRLNPPEVSTDSVCGLTVR